MQAQNYFYGAFLLQVITISAVIPWWVKGRLQGMMRAHPPAEYPKLYPVSPTRMHAVLTRFMAFNAGVMVIGLALLAHLYWDAEAELFGWDNQGGLTVYFLWQYLPFAYLGAQGVKHHQMMRWMNSEQRRSASLQPRRLTDHVTPLWQALLAAALLTYLGTVVYMTQNPFPGFAGYWNILFVLGLNAFFVVLLHFQIKGRKTDPHQSHHDRLQQQRLIGRLLVTGWVLANVFLTINMWLAYWDMRDWNLVIQALYFTLIALIMSQTNVHQPEDYSVYR